MGTPLVTLLATTVTVLLVAFVVAPRATWTVAVVIALGLAGALLVAHGQRMHRRHQRARARMRRREAAHNITEERAA